MKAIKLFSVLVITALLVSLAAPVAAAAPADNPGKGPPEISKAVFVHYPKGMPANGGIPGPSGGKVEKGEKLWYKYSGIHWPDSVVFSGGVPYTVNLTGSGGDSTFLDAIKVAFQTWEDEPNSYMDFTFAGQDDSAPISSLYSVRDGLNVVGWANISDKYSGAIAVAMVWYNTLTGEIVEVDMAMNSDPAFTWHQNTVTGDPDEAEWTAPTTDAYDVDVQNIVTHEVGHWLMLGDLYQKPANDQTMYGRSAEFDLQKRSLESGDEAGIQEIYPGT